MRTRGVTIHYSQYSSFGALVSRVSGLQNARLMEPVVSLIMRCGLAALFAAAGVSKLRDRRRFAGIVLDYRLLPPRLALRVAAMLPWLEFALAGTLLAGVSLALPGAAAVLLAYGAAMTVNLARGRRRMDCGCGAEPQMLSGWLVWRNLLLAAALLLVWARDGTG